MCQPRPVRFVMGGVRRTFVIALLGVLGFAAQAGAATTPPGDNTLAAPGVSGVDQYVESVPSSRGNAVVDNSSAAARRNKGGGGNVSRRVARKLRRSGSEGAATLALAQVSSGAGGTDSG